MKKGYTVVVAAQRIRVGRCHGGCGRFVRPRVLSWYLWLACGHLSTRRAKEPPRSVKCERCQYDIEFRRRKSRDWLPGEIPNDIGIILFR
jgi:hypothetical protein